MKRGHAAMKRQTPDDHPPRRPRRHRALSEEERLLWDTVARSTKPLRTKSRKTVVAAATEVAVQPPAQTALETATLKPQPTPSPKSSPKPSPAPPLALLHRRERSRIARGRKEIDARLDLHGMTQARAHGALLRFLGRAQGEGLTLVLVITGKGTGKGGEGRGVLRHQVPEWLALAEFRSLVVGFEEAHATHGGSGALYVRVRRGR